MTGNDSLERFVEAQDQTYARALQEIMHGFKRSHWMWFIFPQLRGLGRSTMARHYGIESIEEARAYLEHPVLGPRYVQCVTSLQDLRGNDPIAVFGAVDATKLRSSLTLFETAGGSAVIGAALDRWFGGVRDERTAKILGDQ